MRPVHSARPIITQIKGGEIIAAFLHPLINISQSVNSLPRSYVLRALCLQRLYISVTPFPCRVLACHAESSSCRLSRVKKKKRKGKDVKRRVHVILVRFIHDPTGRQVVPRLPSIFPRLYVKKNHSMYAKWSFIVFRTRKLFANYSSNLSSHLIFVLSP